MTRREEEIIRVADENYLGFERRLGFMAGANWADKHPKKGLANLKDSCTMKWLPIDRDDSGFATEETLNAIVELYNNGVPIAMLCGDTYEMLSPNHDIYCWYGEIERNTNYTHYLPINKLEL
jgi:hypothetical protein